MVNEHISILNKEIESLIRQVELPPAEAIEWRAAYEEVKENLDKQMNTNDNSIIPEDEIEALSKKRQKLEHKLKDNTNNLKECTHSMEKMNEEQNKIKADKALSKEKQKLEHELKDSTNNLKEYTHSMEKMNEELNKIKADKYRAVQVMELKIGELETSQKDLLKEISLFESGMD